MYPENQNPASQTPSPDIVPTSVTTQQTAVLSPTEPPVMHEIPKPKSKIMPILIVTLLLIGFGSLGYWVYQNYFISQEPTLNPSPSPVATVDPTANWKTYSNTKYSYTLKYPPDYEVNVNGMGDDTQITGWLVIGKPDTDYEASRFSVSLMDSASSLESAAAQHLNKSSKYQMTQTDRDAATKNLGFAIIDPVIQEKLTKTTVLGLPAYTYTIKSNVIDDGASESLTVYQAYKFIWIEKNNKIFLISYTDSLPTNQILSTFKFEDQTADLTANWKEYTDSGMFLRVKYPNTWRMVNWTNGYGVGPLEIPEDILWAVNFYGKSERSKESILGEIGNQFSDKKQTTRPININGIAALEIITTTPSIPTWYSDTILLEYGTTYVTLSNGAISDSDLQKMKGVPLGTTFKDFYSTIKFMNE